MAALHKKVDALQRGNLPRMAALAVVALVLAGLVFAFGGGDGSFFRVEPQAPAVMTTSVDTTAAMLEPLPEAPAQLALDDARRQIAQRQLTAPEGANAYESVLEAWHVDSTNPMLQQVIAELTGAFTSELLSSLKAGNIDRARDYFQRATMLGERTGNADTVAHRALREKTAAALQARVADAAKRYDRDEAQRMATLAGELGLPAAMTAKLVTQANAIPKKGETVAGDPGRGVLHAGAKGGAFVLSRKPVTRGEFARFSAATSRPASICRERASLLRVLSPRSWKAPGFEQGDAEPVVCVSMADAESYARWLSQQTGKTYRLPTAAEARETAAEINGRAVSLWLRDCGGTCQQRQASGSSWRSKQGQRPLPSARGYDDVGFRLVREP
jgi:hypothetical protein